MKMAASASPADQERIAAMMARRKTLNPNQRTTDATRTRRPSGGMSASGEIQGGASASTAPKPAWQQLRERGIAGQGSAAANKAALAAGAPPSGPIMAPGFPAPPTGGMVRPMTPEMVNQAQAMPGGMGDRSGAKPLQGATPDASGGQVFMENLGTGAMPTDAAPGGMLPDAQALSSAIGAGPGQMPPGVPGLPPELMQRLQSLRMAQQSGAPGMAADPTGGRGFVPPGQGAPSGAPTPAPRPYGLQSFYGA